MTMTETPAVTPTPKKRRYAARRKVAARPKKPSELAGLTITECASACYAAAAAGRPGCVISGRFYCGHPAKGGLQGTDMHNDAATARVDAARKMLGKATIKIGKL